MGIRQVKLFAHLTNEGNPCHTAKIMLHYTRRKENFHAYFVCRCQKTAKAL